jgi:YegS/Rv2252/BmrU family lipid kinase
LKKKIRFIINPVSGISKKNDLPGIIERHLDKTRFEHEIAFTQYAGHATTLSREAAEKNYFMAVAAGGDGSVNETAKGLAGTETILGIIPAGSGNGLARHFSIPLSVNKALQTINTGKSIVIDTATINDHFFDGIAGIGFDAHIAHLFSSFGKRGLASYVKLVAREYSRYREQEYKITINGKSFLEKAFLISFANGSQFGNDAVIAPKADTGDGLLEVCILQKPGWAGLPGLLWCLFSNKAHCSGYLKTIRASEIKIESLTEQKIHIDGEPAIVKGDIHVKVNPLSLHICVPGDDEVGKG